MRKTILFAAFIALSTHTWAATFDRQAFLSAVKERIKAEQRLMELSSTNDPLLIVKSDLVTTEGWQKDLVSIPGLSLPLVGPSATFGLALAYVTSQEMGIPFASSGSGSLIWLHGDGRGQNVSVMLNDDNFGSLLLRAVFDQNACSIQQRDLAKWTRITPQFANSICNDLKLVVADARKEFKGEQVLIAEKEAARNAIQRTQDLLKHAPDYANHGTVEASIASLETSLVGNDINEIQAKAQGLTNARRDLEGMVSAQQTSADALATAVQTGNQQLQRTENLLLQAPGYPKTDQVVAAKRPLELALNGEDVEAIKAKTQALEAATQELAQFAGQRNSATVDHPTSLIQKLTGGDSSDWFMVGMSLVIVVVFGFFSIPTLVAFSRHHRNRWAILVLNLAFGVTLVGWVIALIWALNKVDDPVKGGVKIGPAPPDPVL